MGEASRLAGRLAVIAALALALPLQAQAAALDQAKEGGPAHTLAFLPQGQSAPAGFQLAQASGADLAIRLQQLEGLLRGMNGRLEQLEFQNRRLDEQLKRFQGDVDFRFQDLQGGAKPGARPPPRRTEATPPSNAADQSNDQDSGSSGPGPASGPANLGRLAAPSGSGNAGAAERAEADLPGSEPGAPMVLAPPGGRPVDTGAGAQGGGASAPSQGSMVAAAPTSSARDEFDLGVGFIQRKDYELAEITLRRFLQEHPGDRLAADAQYWLGESLYQRGQYRPAAEIFLKVTTGTPGTSKAPDSLLRLGMSLSGLGEKEAACATYAEVTRKYPRAGASVKAQLDRETKRVRC